MIWYVPLMRRHNDGAHFLAFYIFVWVCIPYSRGRTKEILLNFIHGAWWCNDESDRFGELFDHG